MNSATRDAYGQALEELARTDERVVALEADLGGATRSECFKSVAPERYFDMGIAEADMIGTAAGLATCGKIPFASTFAIFATGRAFDQVRNSVCYSNLNVKVVGSHAGISVGPDGGTHQAIEDIALMRAVPNMTVVVPADDVEARAATLAAAAHEGPMYLRMSRQPTPTFHDEDYEFDLAAGEVVREGDDVSIIACGLMVAVALEAAEQLGEQGISARVVNMHTIKPLDEDLVIRCARETRGIVTAEEANVLGGLGSAVCEVVGDACPAPVKRVGVEDVFGRSGTGPQLFEAYGLTAEHIVASALELVEN